MLRQVHITKKLDQVLASLTEEREGVNGILLYKQQEAWPAKLYHVVQTIITNRGEKSYNIDSDMRNTLNHFFIYNQDYKFMNFYTQGKSKDLLFKNNSKVKSYERQLREDEEHIEMEILPNKKILHGRGQPLLYVASFDFSIYQQYAQRELNRIAKRKNYKIPWKKILLPQPF